MDETHHNRGRTFAFTGQRPLRSGAMPGVFATGNGECCVWLAPLWEDLFSDLPQLGSVALIMHNEGAMLGATVPGVEFLAVPESEEFIEQHTGVSIRTTDLGSVLAVEEARSGVSLLSLQFFDLAGRGEFKLLLTAGSDLEYFYQFTHHYGLDENPAPALLAAASPVPAPRSLVPARAEDVRALWPHLRHATPGRWLSGRPGVSRLDALALLGPAIAREVSREALILTVLTARRHGWVLRLALDREERRHETALVPRWVESCSGALHIFDEGAEAHLFPEQGGTVWRVRWAGECVLEWFDPTGERLLTMRGPRGEPGWNVLMEELP
jgi:putative heme degradation protein